MLKLHKQNKRTKKLIRFFLSLFNQSWIISITLIFLLYVSCYSTISCWSKLAPDSLFSKYIPHGGHHHAQYNISRLNFAHIFSNGEGLNSSKYSALKTKWCDQSLKLYKLSLVFVREKAPMKNLPGSQIDVQSGNGEKENSEKNLVWEGSHLERVRTKHGPGSVNTLYGQGPRTTIMGRVHGHFFKFL